MLKLDKQKRLLISQDVREIAQISVPCKVYCIYDNGTLVLKQEAQFGTDKVVSGLTIDEKGRITIGKILKFVGMNESNEFLVWCEPGAIHIEKTEGR